MIVDLSTQETDAILTRGLCFFCRSHQTDKAIKTGLYSKLNERIMAAGKKWASGQWILRYLFVLPVWRYITWHRKKEMVFFGK